MSIAPYVALLTALASTSYTTAASAQTTAGPIARAVTREATRLAAQSPSSPTSQTRRAPPNLSDWAGVAAINPGDEIVLTTTKSSRTKRRLLTADSASVTVLNVGDPAIPDDVREALEDAGEDHPGYFAQAATAGSRFALTKHVRLGPDGVFQDDRRLFDVAHVTEVVPREDVIEVGVMGKHVARHARRGVLIGAAVGAVFMTVAAATCSDTEDCNAAGFALLGAAGGALVGVEIGTIVGAIAPRLPDVVYRR